MTAAPRTMYVLLWFPKPSETFIHREVTDLHRLGLPLRVLTLYGRWTSDLSADMSSVAVNIERLGWRGLPRIVAGIWYWLVRKPALTAKLFVTIPWRFGGSVEKSAENVWAFLCAFPLAKRCKAERIDHIHASWACGPATAAWVASQLTGIPFTFAARAWDIYPPDAWIAEKIRAGAFVRSETQAGIRHLTSLANASPERFRLTRNGVPLSHSSDAPLPMQPPYRLLAMGRFVAKKGFDQLLATVKILTDDDIPVELTLVGDGALRAQLERTAERLRIADRVHFPGFCPHDRVPDFFRTSDIFVMPSIVAPSSDRDGIPTVILEALMHRLPVIATGVSGIPELIEDGVTGLLVPQRDPAALASAVRRLVANREAALAMAERGRSRVLEQFDPQKNHRALLELYATVSRG